jgi:hypothetical protein
MDFDPAKYGPEVAQVLALDGNGNRLLPLLCGPCSNPQARIVLAGLKAEELFPGAKKPEAAMAGLWLYFSCFEEAHEIANDCDTPDGNLWHAILHRLEGDLGNAAYWFRKAGAHPIYQNLAPAVVKILREHPKAEFRTARWDPFAFLSFCERARRQPGSEQELTAMTIQRAEWQLLFDHCARPGR